jgi:hypothetical protein
MAFEISIDPDNIGHAAGYWRIASAHIDHNAGQISLWLQGWRDTVARQDGRAAHASLHLLLHAADLPNADMHGATTAALYQALKARAAREAEDEDARLERAIASITPAVLAGAADC